MNTKWKQVGTVPCYGIISTPAVFCYNRNAPHAGVSPRPNRSSYTDVDFTWKDYRDHSKSKVMTLPFRQPGCRRLGGTIMQHVDDFPTFKIHHDGSVPGSLQPTPVVDANDAERLARKSHVALEFTKDPIVTLRHAKPSHQPLGLATADSVSDQARQLCHPTRLSRIGFDRPVGLISKSPTIAQLIATSPSGHVDLEFDNGALDGQILQPSRVETVAAGGLKAATRASAISRGLRLDDPSLTTQFRVFNPDTGTGIPS
jgi:hypothetical protein